MEEAVEANATNRPANAAFIVQVLRSTDGQDLRQTFWPRDSSDFAAIGVWQRASHDGGTTWSAPVRLRVTEAEIQALVAAVTGPLDTRLTAAEGDIDVLFPAVTVLDGRVDAAEADITALFGVTTVHAGYFANGYDATVGDIFTYGNRWTVVWKFGSTIFLAADRDGYVRTLLDTFSAEYVRSEGTGSTWEAEARLRGARRNCFSFRQGEEFVRFDSNGYADMRLIYIFRPEKPKGAILLDIDHTLDIDVNNGQSWRTNLSPDLTGGTVGTPDPSIVELPDWSEPALAVTLGRLSGATETLGTAAAVQGLNDLVSVKRETGVQLGYAAAAALARLRARNGARLGIRYRSTFTYCHGFPGRTWPELAPGGGVDVTVPPDGIFEHLPWENGIKMHEAALAIVPTYNKQALFRTVSFTHGPTTASADPTGSIYRGHLRAMRDAYRALQADARFTNKGFANCDFFLDQAVENAREQELSKGFLEQILLGEDFGDTYTTGPRYQWPLIDNIHHTALGTLKHGELEGLVKHLVMDEGINWRPLQLGAVTATAGLNTLTINVEGGFTGGALVVDETSLPPATATWFMNGDQSKVLPYYSRRGIVVRVNNGPRTITSVEVAGRTITIVFGGAPLVVGQTYDVGYAWWGPGTAVYATLAELNDPTVRAAWHDGATGVVFNDAATPANNGQYAKVGEDAGSWVRTGDLVYPRRAGITGNLKMVGPPSVFWNDATIDAWLCAGLKTGTVA